MQQTPIRSFIYFFRAQQVKSQLSRHLFQLATGSIIVLLILGIMEAIFYFTIPVRSGLAEFLLFLFSTLLMYILLRTFMHAKSIFNNSSSHGLANQFKDRDPKIGDRLLNALQLEESLDEMETGRDLAEYAIQEIDSKLERISASSLYDPISNTLKKTLMISAGIAVAFILIMHNSLPAAFSRLVQPTHEFQVPLCTCIKL